MAYTWSKEDKIHYKKSEVMQELEKRVIETIQRAEILQEKIALAEGESVEDLNKKTIAYNNLAAAKETAGEVIDAAMADDEVAEDALDLEDDLQNEVVNDLRDLVVAALEENNIKLAYRIERTIDEILEQAVVCE
jgi:hypothetical protein